MAYSIAYDSRIDEIEWMGHCGIWMRDLNSKRLFERAFTGLPIPFVTDFILLVFVGDRAPDPAIEGAINLSGAIRNDQCGVVGVPDFVFEAWPEVGIQDYEVTRRAILAASKIAPADDRLFWAGNARMNVNRRRLVKLATEHPSLIHVVNLEWQVSELGLPWKPLAPFTTLPDHCQYRYLIDIEGVGYSARTKLLMFTGRPLFLQERTHVEYWYQWLRPFVHYIPVANDLSDLIEQIEWANAHPEECDQIAENARQFALKYLTREAAVRYLRDVLATAIASWHPDYLHEYAAAETGAAPVGAT